MKPLKLIKPGLLLLVSTAFGAFALATVPARGQNWAERLGFPPDARVLLLHANEAGMCYETGAAAAALLEVGPVRSASAMAPCPWFANFAEWRRSHADADVGLELTFNSEHEGYRWQPLSLGDAGASLRDAHGFLWKTPIQTMVNATVEDVEHEVSAQLERAQQLGMAPTHLTTHLGALVTRPEFIEIYLRIARKHWIPAVVVELTPEHIARFEAQGFPLPEDIIELLSDYPLPKVDDLRMAPAADSYEAKKEALLSLLQDVPPGITQIAFSPAVASDALPQITSNWQQRVWDAELMRDADVAAAIKDGGFMVTDWRELMGRFEGSPAVAPDEPGPQVANGE